MECCVREKHLKRLRKLLIKELKQLEYKRRYKGGKLSTWITEDSIEGLADSMMNVVLEQLQADD